MKPHKELAILVFSASLQMIDSVMLAKFAPTGVEAFIWAVLSMLSAGLTLWAAHYFMPKH